MICLHYDGIDHTWVIQYRLEGTPVRTVRTNSVDVRERTTKDFLAHEKAVASGARMERAAGTRRG